MPEAQLLDPLGAYKGIADFTLFRTDSKVQRLYPRRVDTFRANDTIAIYQAVALVAATTTVPVSVELLDVSDAFAGLLFVGVAQHAAVAGDVLAVCTWGFTPAKVDTSDPIFGDAAIKGAADGQLATAGTLGGTWDGSDVSGTACGVWLDAEDASDYAPLWVQKF